MTSILGQLIDGSVVEDDVKNHLSKWLPTYLAQLAEDRGLPRNAFLRDDGTAVGSWTNTTEFDVEETTALPAILIINTGLAERPRRNGDGSYDAAWVVGIGGLVSAGGDDPRYNTGRLAKRFAGAVKLAMLQYSSLGNPDVMDCDWQDEGYDDVPSELQRSLASFRLVFRIEYQNVLNANLGPGSPDPLPDPVDNPYPDWGLVPDIDHVKINVTKEDIA
jgi:hypothetical protein